ncbi:MAG TPA: hypothetical protein VFI84_02130 [Candidatus Saccharimonadales bacterium]|nr:hypothetical protein [Candidatus Saccharimonadales bacterium]
MINPNQAPQSQPVPDEHLHQAMLEQIENAQVAAQENGTLFMHDRGTATPQVTRIEAVGKPDSEGPYVRAVTKIENTGEEYGLQHSEKYDGHSNKGRYGDSTRTEFQFNTEGIKNEDTNKTEYARVARYDENGKLKYEHRYTDPKTALKFGALIAKHAAQRELSADSETKKAA